ncbi:hypothetical protein [Halovivax limisalsi]|uniref:hypothetical protein n=1 Tax=Halovivax limisalsi TaxID=1453760 RepID=UPI001FFC9DFA|nr:hypothetical protein [Halovivax limisalsi]
MTRSTAAVCSLLLVTSLFAMAVPGPVVSAQDSNSEGYTGAHVDFAVDGNALADVSVDGETTFDEVRVQSKSSAGLGAGVGLGAVVNVDGAGLSLAAETDTSATITAESGAELSAHDTERGQLVIKAGGDSQVVEARLAGDASATADGDAVVVDSGDRTGAFVVVGDGDVTVNDEGNVSAELSGEASLVFRSYADGERDERAKAEERLIADGSAAVELHVEERAEGIASEAVTYSEETSTEVSTEAQNRVEVTIDRSVSEGTIVLTSVSEAAVGSFEDLSVAVDGEAAAEASSMSELEAGAAGEEPRYMVTSQTEAKATVAVAIDHFSERTMTMSGADADGDGDDGSTGDDGTDGSSDDGNDDGSSTDDGSDGDDGAVPGGDALPGFGPIAALLGLIGAIGARIR